jgi:hypothetical protein
MSDFLFHNTSFTQDEIKEYFSKLTAALADFPLPTEHGKPRIVASQEFMLMHRSADGAIGFKHRDTRNYIFLLPREHATKIGKIFPMTCGAVNGYFLYVPVSPEPFMRGYFDTF